MITTSIGTASKQTRPLLTILPVSELLQGQPHFCVYLSNCNSTLLGYSLFKGMTKLTSEMHDI